MVDLVVLACVLRVMTKEGRQFFVSPKYFLLEPPLLSSLAFSHH